MIKSLKLKNFKRHKEIDITLVDGLNLVVGPNYTGKSTILQGILFCLFGVSAVPGKADKIIRRGATTLEGEMVWDSHGSEYRVRRTKGSAKLWEDGELVASSASAVTSTVEKVLGMTKKQFLQLQYSEQKKAEALLTIGASELNKTIEDVSGVNLVNDVLDKCRSLVSTHKGGLEALGTPVDLEELDKQIDAAEKAVEEENEAVEAAKLQGVKAQDWVDREVDALNAAEVSNAQRETGLKMKSRIETKIKNGKLAVQKIQDVIDEFEPLDAPLGELQLSLTQQEEEFADAEKATNQYEEVSRRLRKLTEVYLEEKQELERLDAEAKELPLTESVEELEVMYDTAKAALVELQRELNAKKKAFKDGVCSECGRPLDGHDDVHDIEAEITHLSDEYAQSHPKVEELAKRHKAAINAEKTRDRITSQINALQKPMQTREEEVHSLEVELDNIPGLILDAPELKIMSKNLVSLRHTVQGAEKQQSEYDEATQRISVYENALSELQNDLESLVIPDELDMGELQQNLNEAKSNLRICNEGIQDAQHLYSQAESTLTSIKERLRQAKEVEAKRKSLNELLDKTTRLQKFLRENRDRFLGQVWSGVMGYTGTFSSSCTSGEIEAVGRNVDEGAFFYTEEGYEMPVEAASGAQKAIMGLGVQMSLSQLLPCSLRAVMLDEPTADMDDEKALTLSTMLSQADEQVIMVTHRPLDTSVADHVISLEAV